MKNFSVYHFDMTKYQNFFGKWRKIPSCDPIPAPKFPQDYKHVANVEAEGVDKVFELTNHITSNWEDNRGVMVIQRGNRSTSVGDIVVDTDAGVKHLCESAGWTEERL